MCFTDINGSNISVFIKGGKFSDGVLNILFSK